MRTWFLAVVALLAVAGAGSFFAVLVIKDGASSEPDPLSALNDRMTEFNRLAATESARPKVAGEVNGIRLYGPGTPTDLQRKGVCAGFLEWEVVSPVAADGTALAIEPGYLPDLPLRERGPEGVASQDCCKNKTV
jgi:hypothetical protein